MKSSLILGGDGSLGRAMVSTFKARGWRTVSLDVNANAQACENVIVSRDQAMKTQVG